MARTTSPDHSFEPEEKPQGLDSQVDHVLHFQKIKLAHERVVTGFGDLLWKPYSQSWKLRGGLTYFYRVFSNESLVKLIYI